MPELPELWTISVAMKKIIKDKIFASVEIKKSTIIKNIEMTDFEKTLRNEQIIDVKYENNCLIFFLTNDKVLISSPKQNGNFSYFEKSTEPGLNTLAIFKFKDESELHFHDPDFIGSFHLSKKQSYNTKEPVKIKGTLPEITDFEVLYNNLYKKNKTIKWALKSNEYIVGIGNIYADEILFQANIHPFTSCKKVSKEQIRQIVIHAQNIMENAIQMCGSERKSIIDTDMQIGLYRDELVVYNQEGEQCKKCPDIICKIVEKNNEISFICKTCQKEK